MRASPKLAGGLVIVFAAFFFFLPGSDLYRDWQLDRSPLRTTATIEHTWMTYGSKGSTHYHAAYHYTINGVTYHATHASVMSSTYDRLQDGEVVPIRYLPDDFTKTRIDWDGERDARERNEETGLAIGFAIAVIGVLIAVFAKSS